jgi:hypothetical protein
MMLWKNSHFLTAILTPALRVWLTSQLEAVQGLQIQLKSSDQQLLRGIIPQILLESNFAIYQGLQFDEISLTAEQICINVNRLFQGQPLQLLNPIPLSGQIRMTNTHLNHSLASPLLHSGVKDLLSLLLKTDAIPVLHWEKITLEHNQFILEGQQMSSPFVPIKLRAEVTLSSPQHLLISPLQLEGLNSEETIAPVEFDLGSQVHLKRLNLTQEAVFLQGCLTVLPEETSANQGDMVS